MTVPPGPPGPPGGDASGADQGGADAEGAEERRRRAVDAAWADIVAHWEGEVPGADQPAVDRPGAGRPGADRPAAGGWGAGAPAGGGARRVEDDDPEPSREPVAAGPSVPAGPRDHTPLEEPEGWVAPDPPPLPRGPVSSWLPWAAVLGGPLLALLAALLRPGSGDLLFAVAAAAFVGGFVVLVARMPSRRDDDDDGARL